MYRQLVCIGLLLILVACRGAAKPTPRLEAPHILAASTPVVQASPITNYQGNLIYVQGRRLMTLDPEPRLLADGIDTELIYLSPDQHHLLFSIGERRSHTIYRVDVVTSVHPILTSIVGLTWEPRLWSPDGVWVVIAAGANLDLVALDGSSHLAEIGSSLADAFWTSDGRLLILDRGNARAYDSAVVIDPQSATRQSLDIGLQLLGGDWDGLLAALAGMDIYLFISPQDLLGNRYGLQSLGNGGLCQTWQVVSLTGYPIYSVENTYRLSNLTELANGDWLFLQWQLPFCRLGVPQVALMHLSSTTSTVETVVTGIFGGVGFNQFRGATPLYTIAPNRQSVIWVGGGVDVQRTSLHLLNLTTHEAALLYEERLSQRTVVIDDFIAGVFWLNPPSH